MRVLSNEMMGFRVALFLALVLWIRIVDIEAQTNDQDAAALRALTVDWENKPPNWIGGDPCGSEWVGIRCTNSRITEITLQTMNLKGELPGDIAHLSALRFLDLSYNKGLTGDLPTNIGDLKALTRLILIDCGFKGRIPHTVGSLVKLVELSLNGNEFSGEIPASIGKLKHLYWLDLANNQLTGGIPVSQGDTPGLDLLLNANHFHFGMNKLSGKIPPKLFNSSMKLKHVLFDNNILSGSIPSTLGDVKSLVVVRFDRNLLNGDLPTNIGNLSQVKELVLSHNAFTGPIPNLSTMETLSLLDLSNNSFEATEVPKWIASLQSLTTLIMEGATLEGPLPEEIFNIPQLQTVRLKNNQISGTFEIGSNYSRALQLIDLHNNSIDAIRVSSSKENFTLSLVDNPFCHNNKGHFYCKTQEDGDPRYKSPSLCVPRKCSSDKTLSPDECKCQYPFSGTLIFRAPSSFGSDAYFNELHQHISKSLGNYNLSVRTVAIEDLGVDEQGYLNVKLQVFPLDQDYFNRSEIISIASVFSNQVYKPDDAYGPYVFRADVYTHFDGESRNNSQTGIIAGVAVGASVLVLLLICVGWYAFNRKKRANKAKQESDPFVSWDKLGTGGDVPRLKGARFFKFEELQKCTHNFSEANNIGSGGYGKVYKGILPDGQKVAIKRSKQGSMQGSQEFKNEVELLSRVHHKNLVKLVGFCFDKGEQTLVYEFIPNGTLMESLSGKSGIQMDWIRRLMVTLGSARGLQYLHELADPPIIHRDIKSSNILLDERLTSKVADFGLSKLFGDTDQKGYVTTQVKGTMGYLDPEYYMTNQLTEKSDIFSFGVVMLEMVTARQPIQDGKYIVREIKETLNRTKDLYNLHRVIDPLLLTNTTTLVGLEKFVDLALECVQDEGTNRPTMGEVVKEIENIVKLAGMNPNAESTPSSQTYDGANNGGNFGYPYSDNSLFHYSGSIPLTRAE